MLISGCHLSPRSPIEVHQGDELEVPGSTGVRLDVRGVRSIDTTGIALLIGANHRAAANGRRLVLIDNNGTVTAALSRKHMLRDS